MDNFKSLANLSQEEAIAIYRQGEEFVVFKLLELSEALRMTEAERDSFLGGLSCEKKVKDLSAPSGAIPPYEKDDTSSKRKKKPGRKKGHKGVSRKRPTKMDKVEEHRLTHCPDCGNPLPESDVSRERIIEDIPEVVTVVTRHIIYRGYCKCCDKLVEPKVTAALSNSNVGLRLMTLTAWLHYGLGITVSHILEVLNSHLQFKISGGGLTQMWGRLGKILLSWYDSICEEARSSSYLHADETGWRVDGGNYWLWCFTNPRVTCYMIEKTRGSPALKNFFGEIFEGVLITDFWRAYRKICRFRQACFVHLFREIAKVTQKNDSEDWLYFRQRLLRWMRDATRLDKNDEISPEARESRKKRLHNRLFGLIEMNLADSDCRRIQKRLREYQKDLLTFLNHEGVSSDNNRAEREIRPTVIIRKNSCHNKSNGGAKTQAVLMSIYRTLKLRGHNPLSTVVEALKYYIENDILPSFPEPVTSES